MWCNITVACGVIKMVFVVNDEQMLELFWVKSESLNCCLMTSFYFVSAVFHSSLLHLLLSLQTLSGWWMELVCAQADWRWSLTSLTSCGPQCVKLTLTSRMQRWSVGSSAVGLLPSSRGRSMEKRRLQCGPKSSSVEVVSLLSWTVGAQAQLETPAHLEKLLDSPAQVEELQLWFSSFLFLWNSLYSLVCVQNLSGWWEETVAVQEHWSCNIRESGDQWVTLTGAWRQQLLSVESWTVALLFL